MINPLFYVKKRDMESAGSSQRSINEQVMALGKPYAVYATNLNQTTGLIHCLIATEQNRLMSYACDLLELVDFQTEANKPVVEKAAESKVKATKEEKEK